MTLHQLLHTITYNLTEEPNHPLYNHFIKNEVENEELGGIWWFVIGFENEFFTDDFETNPYRILYTSEEFQTPNEAEDFLKTQGYTDIYTKTFTKW